MSNIIRERIRKRIEALGTNASRISRAADLNPEYLRQFLSGKSKTISVDALQAIATRLETTPQYLMGDTFTDTVPVQAQTLPVMGRAAASIVGNENIINDAIEYSIVPPGLIGVRDAYCLWVEGESMLPLYRPRDPIFIHPRQPYSKGDVVVVQEKRDDTIYASVKEFVKKTTGHVVTKQYNPAAEIKFSHTKIMAVHRVLPLKEVLGI